MNDFEVMQKMVEQNLDIKTESARLPITFNNDFGTVPMIVDPETALKLMSAADGKYMCMLYIVNMEDFVKVKYELANGDTE